MDKIISQLLFHPVGLHIHVWRWPGLLSELTDKTAQTHPLQLRRTQIYTCRA